MPTVRYTTLDTLLGTGVTAVDYAIPDLGASPDSGSNRIVPSQGFNYYVANLTEYTLPAELNWWGTGSPKSNKFYGDVDYSPWDSTDPGTSYALAMRSYVTVAPSTSYTFQNYPNPFNPRTTIEYGVSSAGTRVRIAVYDLMGRSVRVLVDEPRPAGRHLAVWDGRNEQGEIVASGVYFYDVAIGDFRQAKKLVVLK
ncbi:MAG: T9SS type A sorting domain-containing protein [Candidatus Eisenbacteria bacterium]|nr:T9SS type A sorting domain-containing protein [Candidatus Eisenbacteria bacterium]